MKSFGTSAPSAREALCRSLPGQDSDTPSTAPLSIRLGTPRDREVVQAIAAESMKEFGLVADFANLDRELGLFGAGSTATAAEFVAEKRGQVLGSLILVRIDPQSLKLCGFYVRADSRGCGAGRKLLAHAIAFAKAAGYRRISLETWSAMESALYLYRAFGWVPIRRLDPASGAEWLYLLEW